MERVFNGEVKDMIPLQNINFRIQIPTISKLDTYAKEQYESRSTIIRRAIKQYLDEHFLDYEKELHIIEENKEL